ncbi:MAG: hypothetical protein ACXVCY_05005 [Pseudobdellovibrionaceae bacterium]
MSLAQANKNLKFDKRMMERNLSVGEMTKEELQKYLETLPDLASNVETFTIDGKQSNSDSLDEETH